MQTMPQEIQEAFCSIQMALPGVQKGSVWDMNERKADEKFSKRELLVFRILMLIAIYIANIDNNEFAKEIAKLANHIQVGI